MKLATFLPKDAPDARPRVGALAPNGAMVDLARAATRMNQRAADGSPIVAGTFADMLTLLQGGERVMDVARRLVEAPPEEALVSPDGLRLLAPLPRPNSVRDFMLFEGHVLNSLRTMERLRGGDPDTAKVPQEWYRRPAYYKGNPMTFVGPDADVVWPRYDAKMDYELELGIVIGKQGVNIPLAEAASHIAGYTIFDDFSAREIQTDEIPRLLGPGKAKDFDTGNAMGPYLVTPDEIGDPYNLLMVARIDGEEWSRGTSSGVYWTFEQVIEYLSQDETLYPGDFLGSGTVTTGTGLELDRWLSPGATVELEVERIGILRNRVVKPKR